MEAIAALGLACNILQLVEEGIEVAKVFKKAYDHDSTKEQNDALRLSNDLSSAISELRTSMQQPLGKDDTELNDIAQSCMDKVVQLQKLTASFISPTTRRRDKIKQGIKAISSRSEIKALEDELQTLRKDLDTRILVSLRSRYYLNSVQSAAAFTALQSNIQIFVLRQMQIQVQEHQQTRQVVQDKAVELSNHISSIQISGDAQRQREQLLQSLSFDNVNARKNAITSAHPKTFEWLFEQDTGDSSNADTTYLDSSIYARAHSRRQFHRWLESSAHTFWISGKPGSGKSTLMNFIVGHPSTRDSLKRWCGHDSLLLLESYLWNAGTREQRSYKGLLASLLLAVLHNLACVPDLMLEQEPSSRQKRALTDWSVKELNYWLLRSLANETTHFCIFIDGLDEAEIDSTLAHDPILHLIDQFTALPNVKCCVSSRSLQKFKIAFKDQPLLRLSEINAEDISKYFDDCLGTTFSHLEPEVHKFTYDKLRRQFCFKADGVFLWACLAIQSLMRGIENGDSVDKLYARLEALSPELEDMYVQMWKQQNQDNDLYKEEATLFFKICLESQRANIPLTPFDMILAEPSNYQLYKEILEGTVSRDLERQCESIQTRITTRCAGLLVCRPEAYFDWRNDRVLRKSLRTISQTSSHSVTFVHRTAKDFLTTSLFGQGLHSHGRIPQDDLYELILRGILCRTLIVDWKAAPSMSLRRFLRYSRNLGRGTESFHISTKFRCDVVNGFSNRVVQDKRCSLGSHNWFLFSCSPENQIMLDEDLLGAMLQEGAAWLYDGILRSVEKGSLGADYMIHLLRKQIRAPSEINIPDPNQRINAFYDHLQYELEHSTNFLHRIEYISHPRAFVGVRVCLSEWVVLAVFQLVAQQKSPYLREDLLTIQPFLSMHFALQEKCLLLGWVDHSKLNLRLFSVKPWFDRPYFPFYTIFECNVAFLVECLRKSAKRVGAELSLASHKHEDSEKIEPFIRPLCYWDYADDSVLYMGKSYEPVKQGSENYQFTANSSCAVLCSNRTPQWNGKNRSICWQLTDHEREEIDEEYHRCAKDVYFDDKISLRKSMYDYGCVDWEDQRILLRPPPVRRGGGLDEQYSGKSTHALEEEGKAHDDLLQHSDRDQEMEQLDEECSEQLVKTESSSEEDEFVDAPDF